MKKIFLTSIISHTMNHLIDILPAAPDKLEVAFIPTAADTYEDKYFVEEAREAFKTEGFKLKEADIKDKNPSQLKEELKGCDIIFVAGGNSFYLLGKMKESGFDKIIEELAEKGVIFVGSSAGAVVAGPTIEPIKPLDKPDKASLDSFEALNLVDFIPLPHYNEDENKEQYEEIMEKYSGLGSEFYLLTDEQAMVVEGDSFKKVG